MIIKTRFLPLFCLFALLAACGSAPPVMYGYQERDPAAMERPDAGKARVVFIRPQAGFAGKGVVAIYDGDTLIGGLSGNGYFVYDAKPGEHLFACYADPPGMDFMKADIAGGLTYYVQCSFQDRVLSLAAHMFAIKNGSERMNDIDKLLARLEYSVLTDDGVAMYSIKDGPAGKQIVDTRAAWVDHTIEVDRLRNEWLARAGDVQKAWLLTEDGR